jgi:UDP-2,3-diacylglucosamine pyrophosphatase LpxH
VLRAACFITDCENTVVHDVKQIRRDSVICGHIDTPVIKRLNEVIYIHCGHWVDNCTAIVADV